MINLFFLAGPLNMGIANYIRKDLPIEDVNVALVDERYQLDCIDEWNKVIYIRRMKDYFGLKSLVRKDLKNDIAKIIEMIDSDNELQIFLPHLWHTLGNIFYNRVVDLGYTVRLCNMPEGIGSLRIVKSNTNQYVVNILENYFKKIVMMFIGEKYTVFYDKNDLVGIKYFDAVYSFLPKAIEGKVKEVKCIRFPHITKKNSIKRTCVVLGQPRSFGLSVLEWEKYMQELAQYCANEFSEYQLLYKPHYREKGNYKIFERNGFLLYQGNNGLEKDLLNGRNIDVLISICSTGLVSAKVILGNNIECYAYKCYQILKEYNYHDAKEIKRLFELADVKFIE